MRRGKEHRHPDCSLCNINFQFSASIASSCSLGKHIYFCHYLPQPFPPYELRTAAPSPLNSQLMSSGVSISVNYPHPVLYDFLPPHFLLANAFSTVMPPTERPRGNIPQLFTPSVRSSTFPSNDLYTWILSLMFGLKTPTHSLASSSLVAGIPTGRTPSF